jgi:predicted Zn-dependent protease
MLPPGRQRRYVQPLQNSCIKVLIRLLTTLLFITSAVSPALAQRPIARSGSVAQNGVYPEFRSKFGVIRWVKEQMPLKVYISQGLTLDSLLDPQLGAPYTNIDNLAGWPGLVASVVQNQKQWRSLNRAEGFLPGHYQAALEGIGAWKVFQNEGIISYDLTSDPQEADIYVFFTKQFVDKLGMALFANDIRGYTSKTNFSYKAVMSGAKANFKPVVIILRTTDAHGAPMTLVRMKAAATHEFGHALGIEGHSTNPQDLMSMYYGRGVISPNDAATLRYLYRLQPDLIP